MTNAERLHTYDLCLSNNLKNNSIMKNVSQIQCPECNHQFDIENALSHDIEDRFKKEYQEKLDEIKTSFTEKRKTIELEKIRLEKLAENQKEEVARLASKKVEEQLKLHLSKFEEENKIANEKNAETIRLQKEELLKARKEKLDFQEKLNKLKEREEQLELEVKEKMLKEKIKIKEEVQKAEQQKHYLEIKQRDELVNTLKSQMDDMKRKAEQGSMQSQGEILELEIERLLQESFPIDDIIEVKKGVNGADCMQIVKSQNGKQAGIIAFESKRTKTFSDQWISKLKGDMRLHKADEGVIVTEVMPKDMTSFGKRDGIWICKFEEVGALTHVLRHTMLRVNEIKISNEGKGEKMQVLYDYLISNEFKQQMEAIVNGYVNMRNQIDTEKRSMKRQWKEREKQLDMIIDGATDMYGSIKGIAGNAIQNISALELEPENQTLIA